MLESKSLVPSANQPDFSSHSANKKKYQTYTCS